MTLTLSVNLRAQNHAPEFSAVTSTDEGGRGRYRLVVMMRAMPTAHAKRAITLKASTGRYRSDSGYATLTMIQGLARIKAALATSRRLAIHRTANRASRKRSTYGWRCAISYVPYQ